MINNGSLHYDHDRDGTHTMVGGCEVKFRNFQHDTYLLIRYLVQFVNCRPAKPLSFEPLFFQNICLSRYENDELTVSHDLNDKNAWEKCFSVTGVMLPTGYFIGASAATGEKLTSIMIIDYN